MKKNIFTRIWDALDQTKEREKRGVSIGPTTGAGLPYGWSTMPLSVWRSMQLSTVYRCVEVISDAIASQTWQIMEYNQKEGFVHNPFHNIDYMLNFEPSQRMSRFTMMKMQVAKMLLEGDGKIRIHRNGIGDPIQLDLLVEPVTTFIRRDGSIYHEVGQPGHVITVQDYDMINVLNFTYDGITGVSTLKHAADTMDLSHSSEASARGFFSSGANMSGIIAAEGKLTKEKADAIKTSWGQAFDVKTGKPGGIAVMEGGLEFKPVTVNPRDAQMLQTRKFNVIEICRFFGVSPSKVFDNENLTYSNIEAFQLGFLTDTVSPLNAKIEAEFNRKLLRPSQRKYTRLSLNVEELLRANMDAKSNYVQKMAQAGGYTVNEVRKKFTNMPQYDNENADKPLIQVNMMPIDKAGNKQDNNQKIQENGEPKRKNQRNPEHTR